MGYSDQKYYSPDLQLVQHSLAFGTATASGTNTLAMPTGSYPPQFIHQPNAQVTKVEVVCLTAPNNKQTGNFQLLNGTNTIINVAYGATTTAGMVLIGSYTGTYTAGTATKTDAYNATPANVFGSGSAGTFQLNGTATASGDATGTWDVYFYTTIHV